MYRNSDKITTISTRVGNRGFLINSIRSWIIILILFVARKNRKRLALRYSGWVVFLYMSIKKSIKLSLKQKLFSDYYLEESGNATEAVIKAGYNVSKKNGEPDRNLAKSIASENLTKPDIQEYIRQRLDELGFNDNNVLLQHLRLINQNDDLGVKARAIDLYYKKTGAYSPTKMEFSTNERIDEALDRIAQILPKAG